MVALTGYGACLLVLGLLDALWLGWLMRDFYAQAFGSAMADPVRKLPAALFYLAYPAALIFLALTPRPASLGEAVLRSAVLGALAYGTYDLTNWATLKMWTGRLVLVDVVWGVVISSVAGAVAWWVTGLMARR